MVGSGGTGKTCLINVLKCGEFIETFVPTVFETFTVQIDVDGIQVHYTTFKTDTQNVTFSFKRRPRLIFYNAPCSPLLTAVH